LIASCQPTCVIFNACETFGIARDVHLECAKKKLFTVVGFWETPVVNRACERLSQSLFPFVSGWTGSAEPAASSADAFLKGIGLARDRIFEDEEMKKMFPCRRHMPKLCALPKELPLPDPCKCDDCATVRAPTSQQASKGHGMLSHAQMCASAVSNDHARVWADDDGVDERGGRSYKGSLKAFGKGDDWLHECWRRIFQEPTLEPVGEGQYRCFFSHSFDCDAGPSRAYHFESWPVGVAQPLVVLLHVHYWSMPDDGAPGLPKSINVRRGWRVDRDELKQRAEGHTHDPIPPPPGMTADRGVWVKAMGQFLHDSLKDAAAEKARACAAVDDSSTCTSALSTTCGSSYWGSV
jgi:hypothetical protein